MKTTLFAVVAASLTLSSAAIAQDHKAEHHTQSGWKELDAFHTLLAATWHPAATNDLKPLRATADSLAGAAKTWGDSKVPPACDAKPIKDAIAEVASGSAKVAQLVQKNAADAELKSALHDVHERFEVVEKGCKPGAGHH